MCFFRSCLETTGVPTIDYWQFEMMSLLSPLLAASTAFLFTPRPYYRIAGVLPSAFLAISPLYL